MPRGRGEGRGGGFGGTVPSGEPAGRAVGTALNVPLMAGPAKGDLGEGVVCGTAQVPRVPR